MVFHMKTTLNIDDSVMDKLKQEAARRKTTMSKLVEAGIRRILEDEQGKSHGKRPKLPSWNSGGSLADISNREELYKIMEDR